MELTINHKFCSDSSKDVQPKEMILGEKSAEWKGAAGMHDTTERLFFRDEQMGQVVNISAGCGFP